MTLVFLSPFAVFFGYHLFAGGAEYIRTASSTEWLRAMPGFLVVLALFLAFGIPSWWLLLGRTRLIFDRRHGQILHVLDFRICRRMRAYRVDDVIQVDSAISRSGSTAPSPGSAVYAVRVHFRNRKPITVAHEDRAADAREVAAWIAGYLPKDVVGPPGSHWQTGGCANQASEVTARKLAEPQR